MGANGSKNNGYEIVLAAVGGFVIGMVSTVVTPAYLVGRRFGAAYGVATLVAISTLLFVLPLSTQTFEMYVMVSIASLIGLIVLAGRGLVGLMSRSATNRR